jgi:hypothetical protein
VTEQITANDGGGTTTPELILGYQASRESRNVVHDLIGGGIAITLVEPRPRSGVLRLFYQVEADAFAALALHTRETTFFLSSDDRPHINMTYVLDGAGDIELDEDTKDKWIVPIGFQEVG